MKIIFVVFLFVISAIILSSIVSAEDNGTLKIVFKDSSGSVDLNTTNGRYEVYLHQIYLENRTKTRIPIDLVHVSWIVPDSTEDYRIGNREIPYGYYTIKIVHWTEVKNAPPNTELLPIVITDEPRIINFTDESKKYPVFLHEINGEPEVLVMFRMAEESLNLARWALLAAGASLIISLSIVYYKSKNLILNGNYKYPRCISTERRFPRIKKDYKLSKLKIFACRAIFLLFVFFIFLRAGLIGEGNKDVFWIFDILIYACFAVILAILSIDDIKK